MPKPRRPHVASPDEVRFTRSGDTLIVEYSDPRIATTYLKIGAEKLASLKDEDLLPHWNEFCQADEDYRQSVEYVAREIPLGRPQVKYHGYSDQWVPRGDVLRCVMGEYFDDEPDEPCITIDDRDFTLREFGRMLTTFAGWGMRIEFVPDDELHERPDLKVEDGDE